MGANILSMGLERGVGEKPVRHNGENADVSRQPFQHDGRQISLESISRLLHTLYSAPGCPELWPVFLQDFVKMLGVSAAGIVCQDEKRVNYGYSASAGIDPDMLGEYHAYYGKQDPQIPPMSQIVPGRISLGPELCTPEYFRQTEYFNDFAKKYDVSLYCAVPMSKTRDSLEAVTVYTGFDKEPLEEDAFDFVAFMVPHLQTALHLRRRFIDLNAINCSLESALDLMEYGIVLLGANGLVLRMNRSAEALLRGSDGLVLHEGKIDCASRSESARLRSLIGISTPAGSGAASGGSMLVSRTNLRPLSITAAPLQGPGVASSHSATAALFVYDPESQVSPPIELLRRGHGLTPAEAQLALRLVEGHSLTDAAELLGVTHNTVRSQLKSIFLKTGVKHQGELIRLLLRTHLTRSI